ncbi:Mbov_0396 family ICE element transmembrane protein [Spiroplasma endosymbiont of Nebria brevicollis]|uniref:Mbov_0396 family ICE element transmembrane protein n=1 Tax=Spiroplasma endosymbiont of Nebria brevicollis TaxID=3066284 RepID=UPI00313C6990
MNWLWDGLLHILLLLPWMIFVSGPLEIIHLLLSPHGIFDYLTTDALTNLIFGNFIDDPFNTKHLPQFFLALSIVAVGLIVIMFIMQLIIIQFTETHTIREKLGKAIKNTFLAVLVIVFIPLFFSLINYLITGLLVVLKITAEGSFTDLADRLWGIGAPNAQSASQVAEGYGMPPGSIENWNFILELVAIWFTLYVLFVAAMTLVERIIDLILLFSISPIVASMMPVDQGKRLGVWKEMVIGKFIIGPGTMLPIYIFMQVLPAAVVDISKTFNGSSGDIWLEKQILYALFCTAGAISCLKTQKIINHLVTQNLGVQSAIDSNGAGIAGSIAGKARGFASLASGGAGALKLGKQMLVGGAKDGKNPDGSTNSANGLLKNGLTGYIGKGGKWGANIAGRIGKSHAEGTKAKDFGSKLVSPITTPVKNVLGTLSSARDALSSSYGEGRYGGPNYDQMD